MLGRQKLKQEKKTDRETSWRTKATTEILCMTEMYNNTFLTQIYRAKT